MRQIWMIAFTHYVSDPRVRREAEALVDAGHKVRILCLRRPGQPTRETIGGVELLRVPVERRRTRKVGGYVKRYALFFLLAFWWTSRALLAGWIDAVHVHTMPDFLVFAALLPRIARRRVTLDVHDMMPELYRSKFGLGEKHPLVRLLRWQERLATGFASRVIAVHEPHLEVITARGTKRAKSSVIMNLPDERLFARNGRPPDETSGLGMERPFRLVYHGTLAPRHGVRTAILACEQLRAEMPRLHLRIIGDGDERESLRALVRERGLGEIVTFSEGAVPVDALPAALGGIHLGLVPPRIDVSTDLMLPTKLLEYVQIGIPVICSPLRAVRHYFGEDALTYAKPGDPESWAEAIRRHARDPALGTAQVARADAFLTSHSWSTEKEKLLALYRGQG